jgi:lipid-binding SYLF domain-containing protein
MSCAARPFSDSAGRRRAGYRRDHQEAAMLTRRSLMLAGLAAPAVAAIGARAALALTPQQELVDKARITFEKLITSVEFGELPGYMKRAKAVLIFPELYKGGFILGAEGGRGILSARGADGWSQPAFYDLAAGSLGLQIGGQVSEVVLTIMSDRALTAVLDDQLKFGGDMSIAVGPIGKGLGADTTTNFQADVYSFAKTAGLFGGVSFEGAGIIKKQDWNQAYYGQGASPRGIVMEGRFKNPNTNALLKSLQPY